MEQESFDSELTRRELFKAAGIAGIALALGSSASLAVPDVAFAASKVTKCYSIANKNTTVYSNTALTKKHGTIFPTDEITVLSTGRNYCRVQYPISGGKTKKGYIPTNAIMLSTSGRRYTYFQQITTYRRNSTNNAYGYVAVDDKVVVLGTKGKFTQLRYPVSGGYKIAFVKTDDHDSAIEDEKVPIKAEAAVKARLDEIASGKRKLNKKTCMTVGKKFTGTNSNEQCKGYARNTFKMCFGINVGSTRSKPKNYLLSNTKGINRVGCYSNITADKAKRLFSKAHPGDFVQIRRRHSGSHSAIIYSVSSSGITLLEANTDGKNTVKKDTYSWKQLADKNQGMSLYTPARYKLK